MSAATTAAGSSKTALLALGGAALIGVGVAAGMYLSRPATVATAPVSVETPASAVIAASAAAQPASASTVVAETTPSAAPATTAVEPSPKAEVKPAKKKTAPKPVAESTQPVVESQPAPPPVICQTCGTVTNITPVQKEVETSGVGAVAGGVIGGALGNQIGKGKGRTAMTILGAIGGGMAGNEIEKRKRAETVYEVTVRMDNGSTRVVTVNTPPADGSRVEVHGENLSPI